MGITSLEYLGFYSVEYIHFNSHYSKKCSSLNPRGLVVEGGIFETQNTYQPSCHTHKVPLIRTLKRVWAPASHIVEDPY